MDHRLSSPDPTRLQGRDHPLAALAAVLADARGGTRGVVVIEGDAGMGKTSLVRAALTDVEATVIWGSGDESEIDVDHGIIDQMLRMSPLAPDVRGDLLPSPGDDPIETGTSLVRLIDGLDIDPQRPLVVVVDDAQWADLPSLQALTFAARRLRRDPAVLCVAVRTEGLPRLPAGLLRLAADEGIRLRLEPLEASDVRHLAEERTGRPISAAAAVHLRDHTRGSPLHLQTLLDELPYEAITASAALPSPRSFSTLVLSRLAGCAPEVEALVTAVAVLGDPVGLATAAELAELADPLPSVDAAVDHGLLVVVPAPEGIRSGEGGGVWVATPHPLIRAALLGDLRVGRRAELHRRAATLVGGTAGLRHRLAGAVGPDEVLFRDAMAAAAREATLGAHGSAAALLREAAVVAPDATSREQATLDAVDRFLQAGRFDDALALRPAVEAAGPSALRSFVKGRIAYMAGPRTATGGYLKEAWAALIEAAGGEDSLAGADRELAGRIAAMRAVCSIDRADAHGAIVWSRRGLALSPQQAALANSAHMLGAAYALSDRFDEGLDALDEICRSAEGAGAPEVADAHSGRGLMRLWSHDLEGAAQDFELSLAATAGTWSFVAEAARLYLADVRYRQGRWDDAVMLAELSASLVDDSDQVWLSALPHAAAARPLAAKGEPAAEDHLRSAREAAAAVGAGVGIAIVQATEIEVAACRRDHERLVELGRGMSSMVQGEIHEQIAPWRASYAEALVAVGRDDEASAVAAALNPHRTPLQANDWARAAVAVGMATKDDGAVDAAAEVGLALDPVAVGPYPRARLELAVGRAWRHRGDRRRAADLLNVAMDRFAALGAGPWMEQVDREITASGLRPAPRHDRADAALTPQEQTVAQLVTRGLTNREVAAELVVSAKTIEHHLSRIYSKLGVRSRTELAGHMLTADS